MKILMVNKFLYPNGGSETYIFKVGQQLENMGHEVQYFGMEHENRIVGNMVESYTKEMAFHAGGIQKIIYPFKILYSWEARRKIRVVLEQFRPDVVHLNNINFQLTPSIIDEIHVFDANIKIVFTAHDYQWVCPNHMLKIPATGELCQKCIDGKYSNCIYNKCIHGSRMRSILGTLEAYLYAARKTYALVDAVICPSEFMNQILSHNVLLADKTVTMHNFLDLDKKPDQKKEKGDYILYFGRYDEEKGIRTLLKVCQMLPDIPFVFAGKGACEDEVDQVSNIRNVGFLDKEQMRKFIMGARLTVFPSEWYENCPFSVMESQMYGTPVIASKLGGTPELVQDKITGELFEAGNAEQLRDKVFSLWNDDERCHKYELNCQRLNEDPERRFDTLQDYCKKLVKLYGKTEGAVRV